MRYPIAIEPGDDTHAFGVIVPDLPGCFSAGDTLDEAISNAREAIYLWMESTLDSGHPIPQPSDISIVTSNPEYKHLILAVIDVDPSKLSDKAERINITLPARALRRLDEAALKAGQSRAQYLTELILTAA